LNAIPKDIARRLSEHSIEVLGSRELPHGTQYHLRRDGYTANLNVFRTGRISVDGKPSPLREQLEGWWRARSGRPPRPAAGMPEEDATPRLGIDEAGKGDYFGPLVCAGVRVAGEGAARSLAELGVRDSKTLGPRRVRELAKEIVGRLGPKEVCVVALSPREYERLRRRCGNVNRLLVELDGRIIRELGVGVELVVVDEFSRDLREELAPCVPGGVRLEVRPRAEDDAAVAAASVLARARQLEELDALSEMVGFTLPRGAYQVVPTARRIVRELGEEALAEVAKVSFATTTQVMEGSKEEGEMA